MTYDELRSVVLNHVPPAYHRALLAVIDENRRLRALAPGPVAPLTDAQLEEAFPGFVPAEVGQ